MNINLDVFPIRTRERVKDRARDISRKLFKAPCNCGALINGTAHVGACDRMLSIQSAWLVGIERATKEIGEAGTMA